MTMSRAVMRRRELSGGVFDPAVGVEVVLSVDRHAVGQAPSVTMANGEAHSFHDGEAFFV